MLKSGTEPSRPLTRSLAATRPIMDDIGCRAARSDLRSEPLQFVILKEAGNSACLQSVEGALGDYPGRHDEPHVPEK